MNRGKNMMVQTAVLIVLIVSLVIISVLLAVQLNKNQELTKTNQELAETLEAIQRDDVQGFITRAKKVMAGEILVDDESDHLYYYSYDLAKKSSHPNIQTIDSSLQVLYIHIDGDQGEMKVLYEIRYLDSQGKTVMGGGIINPNDASIWTLEKRNGEWIVTRIQERP